MKIYNSLTRRKEEFVPIEEGKVKMYACGITVSGEAHIGHAFQAMLYDIFRKFLEKQGYQVTYARNYTDVDDKIIARSKETGIPADKYAEMMIEKIDHVMREFDVDDPTLWLKATENIGNIIFPSFNPCGLELGDKPIIVLIDNKSRQLISFAKNYTHGTSSRKQTLASAQGFCNFFFEPSLIDAIRLNKGPTTRSNCGLLRIGSPCEKTSIVGHHTYRLTQSRFSHDFLHSCVIHPWMSA